IRTMCRGTAHDAGWSQVRSPLRASPTPVMQEASSEPRIATAAATSLPKRFARPAKVFFVSPVPEVLIVAKATTARGCRTVRVGIAGSVARNAPAANQAAALGGIGLRAIGPRRAVAAVGLRIRRLHADGHGQNAHACDADQSALHH